MKYFKPGMDHGGALHEGPTITNMPLQEKLKASKRMHDRGVGKVFAPFTRPEESALAQKSREQKLCI
ncbi:MAG: hypothetical protein HOB84_03210 [Candidatus Marinimicrobia bacterium]|jgi:hypothetical protein|nr:hypothetical protein [Candidatus Neomarinimicrobiota bacterium]MBT4713762.1 hypothetical protein [Candidatus Neomarinimicrobiota bacterium]MBT4946415.1 hypothetical protein [Candidatus Neomarinimicrobiota bacterium]MBT5271496.1 hypothetical protein [Candidatus Neomarinimicrobiota bacterium]